jgi:TetR/AcrR family transcriptional repressor of mexJK operon
MPASHRRREEQEQRRQRMVDAAERQMLTRGIEGTTMDAVAAAAGFSKRTLYQYFPSKEALVAAIMLRGLERFNRLTAELVAAAEDGLGQAAACGVAFFSFQRDHAALYRLMQSSRSFDRRKLPAVARRQMQEERDQSLGCLTEAIARGVKDGSIRSGYEPRKTAFLVMSLSVGLVQALDDLERHAPELPASRDELLDAALDFLGAALAPGRRHPLSTRLKESKEERS